MKIKTVDELVIGEEYLFKRETDCNYDIGVVKEVTYLQNNNLYVIKINSTLLFYNDLMFYNQVKENDSDSSYYEIVKIK
jgi:hypothetical protein